MSSLPGRLLQIFTAPTFPDVEKTRQCRVLSLIAWVSIFWVSLALIGGFLTSTSEAFWFIRVGSVIPFLLVSLLLMKNGSIRVASLIFVVSFWAYITMLLITSDPAASRINFALYYPLVIAAGLLFGARGALLFVGLSALTGTSLFYLALNGWPFQVLVTFNPTRNSINLLLGISVAAIYTAVAIDQWNQSIRQVRSEKGAREKSEKALVEERDMVKALMEASSAVSGTLVFEDVLDNIMEQISKVIPSDAVNILLIEGNIGRIVRWKGYDQFGAIANVANKTFEIDKTPNFKYMVETGKPIGEPNTENAPNWVRAEEFSWLRSYVGVPVIVKGKVVGCLNVDSAKPNFYSAQQLKSLQAFAAQIALAVENSHLFSQVKHYAHDLESALVETTLALAKALDVRDSYTGDHGKVTASRAQRTLRLLGGDERDILLIGLAAQLHDIGKIGIPDSILLKPGPLSESEWRIMKKHPEIGAEIISRVKGLEIVAEVILAHQEKFDGSGYPKGIRGYQIPLAARIVKVVDAFGAMTEDRIYRKALGQQKAIQELKENAGRDFDPEVVRIFISTLPET